jgi:hypothetical protein
MLAEEDAGGTHLSLEQDGCDSAEQANTFSAKLAVDARRVEAHRGEQP